MRIHNIIAMPIKIAHGGTPRGRRARGRVRSGSSRYSGSGCEVGGKVGSLETMGQSLSGLMRQTCLLPMSPIGAFQDV